MTKRKFNKNGNKGNFNKIRGFDQRKQGKPRAEAKKPVRKPFTHDEMIDWFKRQGEVRPREGESVEAMLKRFKTKCEKAGILKEVRKREFHKTKGQIAREKRLKAEKRARKERAKKERWESRRD